ncbi:hypothetical protein O3M35_008095 [Rhynocoris fuscipes]|uniref:PIN domain-containing protein n=1 Tax=Rhynocoris fuscipes TaxID=488301 RepID=A0AAW1D7X7_9HEMI
MILAGVDLWVSWATERLTDWKKEIAPVSISEQCICSYFSTSEWLNKLVIDTLELLRYFDKEAELDISKMQAIFNELFDKIKVPTYDQLKLFLYFKNTLCYTDNSFVASKCVLSRIMNTPFDINQDKRKWIIFGNIYKDNLIHLLYQPDEDNNMPSEQIAKQYELLKRYLFVKHPVRYHRNVIETFNEMFGTTMKIKIGQHLVYYTTELPGIVSDNKIETLDQLIASESVYCDIFEDGEYSEDLINYNPIWWSKAALLNAKQCIIASYDKNNDCIKNIYKFNIDKFEDKTKYENLWSPDAAWNFLKDFLQFVKDSVNSIPNKFRQNCFWKFQSFPNDEPFVSCEIFHLKIENNEEIWKPIDKNIFT